MLTNVFKIGGLHHISWFQFLPHESDVTPLPDKSVRVDQKDAATLLVLSSHLLLQKEGFLSTWTNSFVGPWDPSQGLHNPDEKIKLWLFLPGRHSSVVESAQAAVSKLRVVASGLWLAPGDSEEVAAALSQSLRNCIERALRGLSYMRFGDVFSRYRPFSQSEELFRRGQPTVEFIFAATEEAIFVHVIISAKHVRALSSGDVEKVLEHSNDSGERLPVIVSPHGMCGRVTGFCPSDLVKQAYFSSGKFRTSNGFVGLPYHVSQGSGCQLRGQNCYVEVTLGLPRAESDKALQSNSPTAGIGFQKGSPDYSSVCERTFIYPMEAVLVPVLQSSFARSSLKRFWLQNWIGPSLSGSAFFMHCSTGKMDLMGGSWFEANGVRTQHGYNSSSNSNSSSISSSSSDSDFKMTTGADDLEADADSLTCRQSGLSSNEQVDNDRLKLGSKRPRTGMGDSFGQVGTGMNAHVRDTFKSDFGSVEVNNSAITGCANEQIGSHWDWDDDDEGVGMDIQALLSEFGDFGDFFENDALPFGEPPGTAESQALVFSAPDCGDVGSSPCTAMDISDQMLLPVGFPSFESFNPLPPASADECLGKNQEVTNNTLSSGPVFCNPVSSTGEFDHLVKAEALMTFAPEYGAVHTPTSELSSSTFTSPYLPKSRKVESSDSSPSSYVYGATPPPSCFNGLNEKPGMPVKSKACPGLDSNSVLHSKKYYTHVESGKGQHDRRLVTVNNGIATCEGMSTSPFSGYDSTNTVNSVHRKMAEGIGAENLLLSTKTALATEVECIMFQASMCRIRHTLISASSPLPMGLSRLTGSTGVNQSLGDTSTITDNTSSKYEVKKKESIPVRIAGDMDGRMLDGPLNAPVGVWRSVGVSKGAKPTNSPSIEVFPSLAHNSFNEESMLSYGQRRPLQELLDGMTLLVQQATSFVDVALDAECGDGPYGWLALQEQWRRGFSCGPSMVHAGCGGILASCHSLDIAGMELVDPLSVDVHASSVVSLLQSDIKTVLRSAFGILDGPLSVTDWCKGHSQPGDAGTMGDGLSLESTLTECRDSSNASVGSPSQPSIGGCLKVSSAMDGIRVDDTCQRRLNQEIYSSDSEQQQGSRLRPSLFVLPLPAILVGYQDDWLKTSANSLQLWEKAPLEPYALQKHMTYSVICPDIDPLTTAAADFFQQLGTVYETCKLGTHCPQNMGNQMEIDAGRRSCPGFVLLDCPQSMKIESSNAALVGSLSDYFLSLSNGWDLTSFLKSLSKALKGLKVGTCLTMSPKEVNSGPCTVIYVVCPFPEPAAVLQTVIESCVSVGSTILSPDKERRSLLHNQVGKALSCSTVADETSISNVVTLSGFSIQKLVLQIVTVDSIFRATSPALNELVILKETAFTVYNKARRISRGSSNDVIQSSSLSGRSSSSVLMQMASPIPGMWKDCGGPRITGRESELDSGLRPGTWDNTWQTARTGGLSYETNISLQDEIRYMFEPLFILAEPGSLEHGVSPTIFGNLASESSKPLSDDTSGGLGSVDIGASSHVDGSESDQKIPPSLHCCYGWTEDWRWLVCIWTDSRGELLDSHIFPFGGISGRQDTKGLQCLFAQVLQQGCQILEACFSPDTGAAKPRDFVITRIGSFYELECQEWQKAIYSVGGSDVKKWPLQLRRCVPGSSSLQQQDMSLIPDRNVPSSPSPLYSSHPKSSGFMKGGLGQAATRKHIMGGGLLQWVQSITFIALSVDHSLHLLQADSSSPGGTQTGSNSSYIEGFTPVKSLGSATASYILIPSPSMHFLPPTPLQLPTCLTAESPPLAHLLHSKGSAIPLSTGFVVSKSVPKDSKSKEWPSVLSVSLVDYYGGKARGDFEIETHLVLESVAAELHALSWMTVSPAYLDRRTSLPFHCDMVLRLTRLLHFADKELKSRG